ncbi:MAG: hypothetical protein WCF03_11055, partial [Nitrososphaeraceae archaeon]
IYTYDKTTKGFHQLSCSIRKYNLVGGWERGMRNTSSSYLYIHYSNHIKRSLFLLLPNEISLLPLIPSFTLLNVLTDFLTIIKYRKKDINNIL